MGAHRALCEKSAILDPFSPGGQGDRRIYCVPTCRTAQTLAESKDSGNELKTDSHYISPTTNGRLLSKPAGLPGGRSSRGGGKGNTERQVVDGLRTEVCGQQKQSNDPHNNQHNPQYANYWAPLTRKRHPPHPAQPRYTNYWAPRTRKRHQQVHRPQRPTERSDPTQHAKGRTGDCPGPRKETTTRRNVTQGVCRVVLGTPTWLSGWSLGAVNQRSPVYSLSLLGWTTSTRTDTGPPGRELG